MYGRVFVCTTLLTALLMDSRRSEAALCGEIPDTLILLDRSASMSDMVGAYSKWTIANDAVNNLTASFAGQLNFGLALFPGTADFCTVGSVVVSCGSATAAAIASTMQSTYPQNGTPLGDSLAVVATYLQGLGGSAPRYVIVITDGQETCSGQPTDAAAALRVAGVDTYVVGFGSGVDPTALTDLAVAGGTGTYYQADNVTQLNAALQQIAGQLSCCGNSQIDAGELCDITIAAGSAGACPTACNDNDPCTSDSLTGAACEASCSFTPITAAIHNDGCCPGGYNSVTDNDCPPMCGDGVLDAGEACDPQIVAGPGSCPTACDDNNSCTDDALVGAGCDAQCVFTKITQQVSGDGCCLVGATHATDTDCPPMCGNGVLDAGELCDTAIASGAPGSCPTSCDDNDPCTEDTLKVVDCNTECVFDRITQPASGDGCCPVGGDSTSDADCPVVCGNGVVEQGEACDTAIAAGQPGHCPSSCDDGDPCTLDLLAGVQCGAKCETKLIESSLTMADGCCPAGVSSRDDVDCPPPCGPDRSEGCVDLCVGVECGDGEYCELGQCAKWPDKAAADESDSSGGGGEDKGEVLLGGGEGAEGAEVFGDDACACTAGGSPAEALPVMLPLLWWGFRRRRIQRRDGRVRKVSAKRGPAG